MSIQDVVLNDEDNVKEDGDIPQPKFCRVARNTAPVFLKGRVDD